MSAPSIPNLLSLRGASRGGGRGRGLGRGRGGGAIGSPSSTPGHDITVQGTDIDAAVSRLSAVELGYLVDPFAEIFAQKTGPGPSSRRLPIINRGTYTRTTAIDTIVDHFLTSTSGQKRQIVSLGAGTDTRALRLFSASPVSGDIHYHEIDFVATCSKKLAAVRAAPQLRTVLTLDASPQIPPPPPSPTAAATIGTIWHAQSAIQPTNHLWCHGIDLRVLASSSSPLSDGILPNLDPSLPTLLISECCLCYLSTAEASAVVSRFSTCIPDLGLVLYEPVRPEDAFGRMMVTNLAARRIHMPTLEVYREPSDQAGRLQDAGFTEVQHMTVDEIWERWVSLEEKERVDSLEGLDEVEEWLLLAGHYIVAWGWRGDRFTLPETSGE